MTRTNRMPINSWTSPCWGKHSQHSPYCKECEAVMDCKKEKYRDGANSQVLNGMG